MNLDDIKRQIAQLEECYAQIDRHDIECGEDSPGTLTIEPDGRVISWSGGGSTSVSYIGHLPPNLIEEAEVLIRASGFDAIGLRDWKESKKRGLYWL